MTPEQIIITAYTGVMAQGGPSLDDDGGCAYRGENGRKCGIGHLIDDKTAERWDKKYPSSIRSILASRAKFETWMRGNSSLLVRIQGAHDEAPINGPHEFLSKFKASMSKIAADHGVTLPEAAE